MGLGKSKPETMGASRRDLEANQAGRILYGAIHQPDDPLTNSDTSRGTTMTGKISALRRTFCLLVLFDLILSCILWLIYTQVKNLDGKHEAYIDQVVGYSFKTSLFDTVLLSVFRFLVLELCYGLFKSKRPWAVAGTTVVTSACIIAKVVLYQFDSGSMAGLEILDFLIIISSVTISWVETWLMDLRVLPSERGLGELTIENVQAFANETSPLLHGRNHHNHASRTEPSYYTPDNSEANSLCGNDSDSDTRSFHSASVNRSRTHSLGEEDSNHYKEKILDAQTVALGLLKSDGWKTLSGTNKQQGLVSSKHTQQYGNIFKLEAILDCDALTLYNDMVEHADAMPKWNPTVLKVKTLLVVDDDTEISYNVAAEGAGGMVSSRDFVYIRHWEQRDGWYVTCSVSTELDTMPQQPKYVRGYQGPTLIRLKDTPEGETQLEWLLNTNLKGWLPQYLIDQALSGVLLNYLGNLRKHCATLTVKT